MDIRRTFWRQVEVPLRYAASTRKSVVPGSPTGMAMAQIVQVSEADAQLIGSLTASGRHAPVIDIDFPTTVTVQGDLTTVCVSCPAPKSKSSVQLSRILITSGPAQRSARGHPQESATTDGITLVFAAPVRIVPSRTEGHFHLYVDYEMSWDQYRTFLNALHKVGVIGKDFHTMSIRSHQSFVRKPE